MKKIIAFIMVGILVFLVSGCGRNETENRGDSVAANESTAKQETAGIEETASVAASEIGRASCRERVSDRV